MKTKTKPNNSFHNACILRDVYSFEDDAPYMLDAQCSPNPEFYDQMEWDECGNIVKVFGRKVIDEPYIYYLEK